MFRSNWRALLAVVAVCAALVAGGTVASPAVAGPPPLPAMAGVHKNGDTVTVTYGRSGTPMAVTMVYPGIGVYGGRFPRDITQLPDGENPRNQDFVDRVTAVLDFVATSPTGLRALTAIAQGSPLPDIYGNWGDRVYYEGEVPSRINLVIGISAIDGVANWTNQFSGDVGNGLGAVSVMGLDPSFTLTSRWHGRTHFAAHPAPIVGHELGHVWRALSGADDGDRTLLELYRGGGNGQPGYTVPVEDYTEEFRVVGNPDSEYLDPDTEAPASLGPDTQVAAAVALAREYVDDYAEDAESLPRLRSILASRNISAAAIPTEWRIAGELGLMQRTHRTTEGVPHTQWRIRGATAAAWAANMRQINAAAQARPGSRPDLLQVVSATVTVPQCTNNGTARFEQCAQPSFADGQDLFQIQTRNGDDSCVDDYVAASLAKQAALRLCWQAVAQYRYHPDTKLLSVIHVADVSDAGLKAAFASTVAEYGQAPKGLCLAADLTGLANKVTSQPCDVNAHGQQWVYTTSGQWAAVSSSGEAYGCLNIYGNSRDEGAVVSLYTCDTAKNTTWNMRTTSLPAVPAWTVDTPAPAGVINPSFDLDGAKTGTVTGWLTDLANPDAGYAELAWGAHSGTYHLTQYNGAKSFEVDTYQGRVNIPDGTYTLSAWAWIKNANSSDNIQMWADTEAGGHYYLHLPATGDGWGKVSIANIKVSYGKIVYGFYTKARANVSLFVDDVQLTRNGEAPLPDPDPPIHDEF